MKVMQIFQRFCHWDATASAGDIDTARQRFPGLLFVEAPDYVFEGWGYDDNLSGDARFIKPVPPDGFLYDDASGTFYPAGSAAPSQVMTGQELTAAVLSLRDRVQGFLSMFGGDGT